MGNFVFLPIIPLGSKRIWAVKRPKLPWWKLDKENIGLGEKFNVIPVHLYMPPELFTIAGTLAAALVAGVVSYIAGRGMKTHEWRLTLAREELAARKSLYTKFLTEAQRLTIQASECKVHSPTELDTLNSQYAEMTIVSSKAIVEAAKYVFDSVLLAHLRDQDASDANDFHVRKQAFIDSVRAELQSYKDA